MSLDEYKLLRRAAKSGADPFSEPNLDDARRAVAQDVHDMHKEAASAAGKKPNRRGKKSGLTKKEMTRVEAAAGTSATATSPQPAPTPAGDQRWGSYASDATVRIPSPLRGEKRHG